MNCIYFLILCLFFASCTSSHIPSNNHKRKVSANRESFYQSTRKHNKILYAKHQEGNRKVTMKENSEWNYRRNIAGSNNIHNTYNKSGGYDD